MSLAMSFHFKQSESIAFGRTNINGISLTHYYRQKEKAQRARAIKDSF